MKFVARALPRKKFCVRPAHRQGIVRKQNEMASLRGNVLIAGRHLDDPNFARTIVLIVEHGDAGAMGLILNRPTAVSVHDALATHIETPDTGDVLFTGGPVEPQALFLLHSHADLNGDERPVLPGVFLGASADIFEQVIRRAAASSSNRSVRVFNGCSGWGGGQLESEIRRGDWHVLPAAPLNVLTADPYTLYESILPQVFESAGVVPPQRENFRWN